MKTIPLILFSLVCLFCFQQNFAQTLNFNSLDSSKHILNIGVGWDHGVSYTAGYTHKVKTTIPLFLNANLSIPPGKRILDDIKLKFGGRLIVLNKKNLKATVGLNGIYRRYENPLVRLVNFGAEIKGTVGYYKPKWFVAIESGFDKAIVTHFKHSNTFRETVYLDVKDGWYKPSTGGNFYYGLQTGYSMKKSDVSLNIGKIVTQDFKTTPLIPYYLMLGFNYRLP